MYHSECCCGGGGAWGTQDACIPCPKYGSVEYNDICYDVTENESTEQTTRPETRQPTSVPKVNTVPGNYFIFKLSFTV